MFPSISIVTISPLFLNRSVYRPAVLLDAVYAKVKRYSSAARAAGHMHHGHASRPAFTILHSSICSAAQARHPYPHLDDAAAAPQCLSDFTSTRASSTDTCVSDVTQPTPSIQRRRA